MNWNKATSLKLNTIVLLMTIMLLSIISVVGYSLYREWSDSVMDRAKDQLETTSKILESELNTYLELQRKPITTLAKLPEIFEATSHPSEEKIERANSILDIFCSTLDALTCYLMDQQGTTIASSNRHSKKSFVGKNYSFRPYFKRSISGKVSSYLALGITSRKRGVYFSSPVMNQGQIMGVVVIKLSVTEFEKKFASVPGIAAVTGSQGMVFATNKPQWLYKSLWFLTEKKARSLASSKQFGNQPPDSVGLHRISQGRASGVKTQYLLTEKPLKGLDGWKITYLIDAKKIALFQNEGAYKIITSGTGLILLLVIVMTLLLYRAAKKEIDSRRKAERDLLVAKEQAEKASRAKSEFLSSMSHELRTPMNAILGFGQMLELDAKGFTESQRGSVQEILTAGKHLLNLINEVLDLARIESGKMQVSLEAVHLNEVMKHSLTLISQQALQRGISIEEYVTEKDFIVYSDFTRLQQVMINLLSNAVKYNRENGQIIINGQVNDGSLSISIKDRGEGLSAKQIERLFVPFDRLNADHSTQGTGIGLVITRHLLTLMDARLEVESSPGKGSVFRVILPLTDKKISRKK